MDELVASNGRTKRSRWPNYTIQLVAIAIFFGAGLVVSPVSWLLHKLGGKFVPASLGQGILQKFFQFFVWWMTITGILKLRVRGLEAFRQMQGTVFVANHPALIDAVFLVAHLPLTACVMRATLLCNPAMCGVALLARYVTNDSGPAFIRQGIEKIRSGGNLLIFPEGTRTVSSSVNGFKNGFALVAVRTGAPVQSVVIRYSGDFLTKGVSLFSPALLPLQFEISGGPLFRSFDGESAQDFSRRIESWYRTELDKQVVRD